MKIILRFLILSVLFAWMCLVSSPAHAAAMLDPGRFLHTAEDSHMITQSILILTRLTDGTNVSSVKLFYKSPDQANYTVKNLMDPIQTGNWRNVLMPSELSPLGLGYYIEATYSNGQSYRSKDYFTIILVPPPEIQAMIFRDDVSGTDVRVVQGEVILKLNPALSPDLIPAAINDLVLRQKASVVAIDNAARLVRMRVPMDVDLKTVLSELSAQSDVAYAQPHGLYDPVLTPNDPRLAEQWAVSKIRLMEAWDVTTGDVNVIVAVIDTGRDPNHPDLAGKFLPGYDYYSNDGDPNDVGGHGTMVSGVVGAIGNNGVGVAGTDWKCKILPYRTGDYYLSGWAIIQSIRAAADAGARVINMSFGSSAAWEAEHDALKYAYGKGVVLVAAAGNNYTNAPSYPAAYPEVIAAVATTKDDQKAVFSSYGNWVDVSAPGKDILTTTVGGGYQLVNGTSFASPYTAGLAGLILSVNPNLTNEEVRQILRQTAVDLGAPGFDEVFGYGRIDAKAAVEAAKASSKDETSPVIIHEPKVTTPPGISVTIQAAITDNVAVHSATLLYRPLGASVFTETLMQYLGGHFFEGVIPKEVVAPPAVEYAIRARDAKGNTAQTQTYTISMADVTPPVVQHTPPAQAEARLPLTISATITDDVAVASSSVYARVKNRVFYERYVMKAADNRASGVYQVTLPDTLILTPAIQYYFTAADSAGNEPPSGNAGTGAQPHEVSVVYVDRNPPVITHAPVSNGQLSQTSLKIEAAIADDVGVVQPTVYFRVQGASVFDTVLMVFRGNDSYATILPSSKVIPPAVEYYIDATDAAGNTPPSGQTPGTAARPNAFFVPADTIPPRISHEPPGRSPEELIEGFPVKFSAVVLDNRGVRAAQVFYKKQADVAYRSRPMTYTISNRHEATLLAADLASPNLDYYLTAADTDGNETTWGPTTVPVHKKYPILTANGDTRAYWVPTIDQVLFLDSAAGAFARLPVPHFDTTNFAWSPDLTKLVMTGKIADSWVLYVIAYKDTMPTAYPVTEGNWTDLFPSWSADGKYLLFASNKDGDWDIFMKAWDSDGDGIPDKGGALIKLSQDGDTAPGAGEIAGVARLTMPRAGDVVRGQVSMIGAAFALVQADRLSQVPAEGYRVEAAPETSPKDSVVIRRVDGLKTILFDEELAVWDVPMDKPGRYNLCLFVKGNHGEAKTCAVVWVPGLSLTLQADPAHLKPGRPEIQLSGGATYNYGALATHVPVTLTVPWTADSVTTQTNSFGKYSIPVPAPRDTGVFIVQATAVDTWSSRDRASASVSVTADAIFLTMQIVPSETYPYHSVVASGIAGYADSRPLVNREVFLEVAETFKRYFALTDTLGRYSISIEAPERPGVYHVHAEVSDGFSRAQAVTALKVKEPDIDLTELLSPPVVLTLAYTTVSGTAVYRTSGLPLIDQPVSVKPAWIGAPIEIRTDTAGRYIALIQAPAKADTYPVQVSVTDGKSSALVRKDLIVLDPVYGNPLKLETELKVTPEEVWIGRPVEIQGDARYVYQNLRWPVEDATVALSIHNSGLARSIHLTKQDRGHFIWKTAAPRVPDTYPVRMDIEDIFHLTASADTHLIVKDRPIVITAQAVPPDPYRNDPFQLKGTLQYPDGVAVEGASLKVSSRPAGVEMSAVPADAATGNFEFDFISPNRPDTYDLDISASDPFGGAGTTVLRLTVRPLTLSITAQALETAVPARLRPKISGATKYVENGKAVAATITTQTLGGGGLWRSTCGQDGRFLQGVGFPRKAEWETFVVNAHDGLVSADTLVSMRILSDSIAVSLSLDTTVVPGAKSWKISPAEIHLIALLHHPEGHPLYREGITQVSVVDSATGQSVGGTTITDLPLGEGTILRDRDTLSIPVPDRKGEYVIRYEVEDRYGTGDAFAAFSVYVIDSPQTGIPPDPQPVPDPNPQPSPNPLPIDPGPVRVSPNPIDTSPGGLVVGPIRRIIVTVPPLISAYPGDPVTVEGAAAYSTGEAVTVGVSKLYLLNSSQMAVVPLSLRGKFRYPAFAAPAAPTEYEAVVEDGVLVGRATFKVVPLSRSTPWNPPLPPLPPTPVSPGDAVYDELYPEQSPDGKYIVYARRRVGSAEGLNLFISRTDSFSIAIPFTSENAEDIYPAWSPDGKKIAFGSKRSGNYDIWVKEVDGNGDGVPDGAGRLRQISTWEGEDNKPTWSPDGARLAFHSDRAGNYDLYVQGTDGSGSPTRLTHNAAYDAHPHWSKDGKYIVFHSNRMGKLTTPASSSGSAMDIGLVMDESGSISDGAFQTMVSAIYKFIDNLSSGMLVSVTKFDSRIRYVQDFTGDKTLLRQAVGTRIFSGATAMYDGLMESMKHLSDRPGRRVALLLSDGADNSSRTNPDGVISYAKDNQITIYSVFVNTSAQVGSAPPDLRRIAESTGGRLIEVEGFEGIEGGLQTTLTFINRSLINFNLWYMPAEGGEAKQLTDHIADDLYPAFSPDSKKIAFVSFRSGHGGLYILNFNPDEETSPVVSPIPVVPPPDTRTVVPPPDTVVPPPDDRKRLLPTLSWHPSGKQGAEKVVTYQLRNMSNDPKDVAAGVIVGAFVIRGEEYVDTVFLDTTVLGMIAAVDTRPVRLTIQTNHAWAAAQKKSSVTVELRVVQELNWPAKNVGVSARYRLMKEEAGGHAEELAMLRTADGSREVRVKLVSEVSNPDVTGRVLDLERLLPKDVRFLNARVPDGSVTIDGSADTPVLRISNLPLAAGETFSIEMIFGIKREDLTAQLKKEILEQLEEIPWTRQEREQIVFAARRRMIRGAVKNGDSSVGVALFDVTQGTPKKLADRNATMAGEFELPDISDEVKDIVLRVEKPGFFPHFARVGLGEGKILHHLGTLALRDVDAKKGLSRRVDRPEERQDAATGEGTSRTRIDIPGRAIEKQFYLAMREPENMEDIRVSAEANGHRLLSATEYVLMDAQTGEEIHAGFKQKIQVGFSTTGLKAGERAKIAHYDPESGKFEEASSTVDENGGEIISDVEHFSIYASLAAPAPLAAAASYTDFSQLLVYPNPYEASYGTNKIIFENVPATSKVIIYTVSGEMVREIPNGGEGDINGSMRGAPADAHIGWDLTNRFGRPVASGMYLFLLKDGGGHVKNGRVGVVR